MFEDTSGGSGSSCTGDGVPGLSGLHKVCPLGGGEGETSPSRGSGEKVSVVSVCLFLHWAAVSQLVSMASPQVTIWQANKIRKRTESIDDRPLGSSRAVAIVPGPYTLTDLKLTTRTPSVVAVLLERLPISNLAPYIWLQEIQAGA